jgi:hypothetical protein
LAMTPGKRLVIPLSCTAGCVPLAVSATCWTSPSRRLRTRCWTS